MPNPHTFNEGNMGLLNWYVGIYAESRSEETEKARFYHFYFFTIRTKSSASVEGSGRTSGCPARVVAGKSAFELDKL